MMSGVVRPVMAAVLLALCSTFVSAQGGATSSISGTVMDSAGGAVPGASVIVKNESGTSFETVSNAEGVFSVPSVNAGTYTVTVALPGFKTAVVKDVRVAPGTPAAVKAVLEVGQLEETVTVSSSSELINTQTPTVSSTLNSDQLNRMPTPTRNALNAVTFLPGVNTATSNRNSTINGLPDSFVNITLDGISNNDNFLRSSDAFFASVTPRQDAVEAVSVTTAAGGANVGGSGAVSINFATRSGTNQFTGSVYEYYRNPKLNSNYWFNERNDLPKNDVKLNQYGGRFGGPIVIPGLYNGRDKAFFFAHYEQLKFPNSFTRTRTVLHPSALSGTFRYLAGDEIREVNVLSLASANGQIATVDPTVLDLLTKIQAATQTTGTLSQSSDPATMSFEYLSPGKLFEHQPTLRVDYNLTDSHRLSGSTQVIFAERDPDYLNAVDARFPGAPNYRLFTSTRPLHSLTLRSTLSSNLVNEIRGGITALGGASYFGNDLSNGPQTFEDQGGFAIDLDDNNLQLTNWHATNGPSWRSAPTYSLENTLSWQRGKHSFSLGGSALWARAWESAKQVVPGIQLGFSTNNDPARGLFNAANFPGATAGSLNDARQLYALLTGRVSEISGQAALNADTNQYTAYGERKREGKMDMYSVFAQDSWRIGSTLTVNAGLRWDVQMPFTPVNDIMSTATVADICGMSGLGSGTTYERCRFYTPGASGGKVPEFVQLTRGTLGYDTDWNNIAPNIGIAWRPNVQEGFLRTILGDPDQATVRAGYSVAYERQGMGVFTGQFGTNPGSTLDLDRNEDLGLVGPGESWPVLLSQRDRLFTAGFPQTATFPIAIRPERADDINIFAPDIKIASARTWTVSFQRALSKDMAVDIRYVGTRGVDQWSELNYNERNVIENGFYDEFRNAMANLRANNAAGGNRAGSFAYFGPGTGTNPLPIYLAYLNGRTNAGDPAAYTGGNQTWTNSALSQDLVATNAQLGNSAADLDDNAARRANALRAGLPANFFVVNPEIDDANVFDSGAFSDYHALQIEMRRRLSKGLSANINYQYALEGGSAFLGFRYGRVMDPTPNVRHAIKTQWDWTIPVGRGQRFGANLNPILEAIVGGWSFNGVGRIQNRTIDFGNVRLVGMTLDDVTDMYRYDIRVNPANGLRTPYVFPDDVILNTRRAFNVSTTSPTGYSSLGVPEGRYFAPANDINCVQLKDGDCAPRTLLVKTPFFTRFDIGVRKRFPIKNSVNFELALDVLNVLDNVNFNPFDPDDTNADFQSATFGQVTSAYTDASNTYDPGGRLGQLMFRLNW
jgi:hypothetical protein